VISMQLLAPKSLRSSRRRTPKVLTAAVTTSNGAAFTGAALGAYDFINIMSYDHCGWSVKACEHAGLAESKKELARRLVVRSRQRSPVSADFGLTSTW